MGDIVVYPGRAGSSMWMTEGVVEGIEPFYRHTPGRGRRGWKIKVFTTKSGDFLAKPGKHVTVGVIDRVTVVEKIGPRLTDEQRERLAHVGQHHWPDILRQQQANLDSVRAHQQQVAVTNARRIANARRTQQEAGGS